MASFSPDLDKRRPSIELSPTLEKPVFIITNNFNGGHILSLAEELDKHRIAYQLQQETQTIGYDLKQRFFVIVDNKYGEVTLGKEFGSILMTIVGYPRIGKNPKNKYFQRPLQIIAYYQMFKNDRDISDRQKTLIRSQYTDIVIEKEEAQSLKGVKIVPRSISKSRSPQSVVSSIDESQGEQVQRIKLLMLEDKSDEGFTQLCGEISKRIDSRCLVQTVQSMTQVKRKTLFYKNKLNIYYLTSQKHQAELARTITIGELIVFTNKNESTLFKNIINEPKIYAISCSQPQTFKILTKIGFLFHLPSAATQPKKDQLLDVLGPKDDPRVPSTEAQELLMVPTTQHKDTKVLSQEMSKIEAVQSTVSHNPPDTEFNTSVISQTSSHSKKIKRLKRAKKNETTPEKPEDEYYASNRKENQVPAESKNDSRGVLRKKTMLGDEKGQQELGKSKKSLKFLDLQPQASQLKKIKSVPKCGPETVCLQAQQTATMTDSDYFGQARGKLPVKSKLRTSDLNGSTLRDYWLLSNSFESQGKIHALFYRQFIPSIHNVVQTVKLMPSGLFQQNLGQEHYQPFFNTQQFDRAARKIKRRLRERQKDLQQFNFVVFTIGSEADEFQRYVEAKNRSYLQDRGQMQATFNATGHSIFASKGGKVNIFLFVDSENSAIKEAVVDYGIIKLYRFGMPALVGEESRGKVVQKLASKIAGRQEDNSQLIGSY